MTQNQGILDKVVLQLKGPKKEQFQGLKFIRKHISLTDWPQAILDHEELVAILKHLLLNKDEKIQLGICKILLKMAKLHGPIQQQLISWNKEGTAPDFLKEVTVLLSAEEKSLRKIARELLVEFGRGNALAPTTLTMLTSKHKALRKQAKYTLQNTPVLYRKVVPRDHDVFSDDSDFISIFMKEHFTSSITTSTESTDSTSSDVELRPSSRRNNGSKRTKQVIEKKTEKQEETQKKVEKTDQKGNTTKRDKEKPDSSEDAKEQKKRRPKESEKVESDEDRDDKKKGRTKESSGESPTEKKKHRSKVREQAENSEDRDDKKKLRPKRTEKVERSEDEGNENVTDKKHRPKGNEQVGNSEDGDDKKKLRVGKIKNVESSEEGDAKTKKHRPKGSSNDENVTDKKRHNPKKREKVEDSEEDKKNHKPKDGGIKDKEKKHIPKESSEENVTDIKKRKSTKDPADQQRKRNSQTQSRDRKSLSTNPKKPVHPENPKIDNPKDEPTTKVADTNEKLEPKGKPEKTKQNGSKKPEDPTKKGTSPERQPKLSKSKSVQESKGTLLKESSRRLKEPPDARHSAAEDSEKYVGAFAETTFGTEKEKKKTSKTKKLKKGWKRHHHTKETHKQSTKTEKEPHVSAFDELKFITCLFLERIDPLDLLHLSDEKFLAYLPFIISYATKQTDLLNSNISNLRSQFYIKHWSQLVDVILYKVHSNPNIGQRISWLENVGHGLQKYDAKKNALIPTKPDHFGIEVAYLSLAHQNTEKIFTYFGQNLSRLENGFTVDNINVLVPTKSFGSAAVSNIVCEKVFTSKARPVKMKWTFNPRCNLDPIHLIFKKGGDLTKDTYAQAIFNIFNTLWANSPIKKKNRPYLEMYSVLPVVPKTFKEGGLAVIDFVPNTSVEKYDWNNLKKMTPEKRRQFLCSLAGAFLMGHTLSLRDRHKDNMLVREHNQCYLMIDFEFILCDNPKYAPCLAIASDFQNVLTEIGEWADFISIMGEGFAVLRRGFSLISFFAGELFQKLVNTNVPRLVAAQLMMDQSESNAKSMFTKAVGRASAAFILALKNWGHTYAMGGFSPAIK